MCVCYVICVLCILCVCVFSVYMCVFAFVCVCVFMYFFVYMVKNPPASARATGDAGSIPGSGRSPGEGNDNPLQYSLLGNSMDRGSLVGYSPWGPQRVTHD